MNEFLSMGGQGFYIWASYAVAAIVVVAEVIALRSRRRAALDAARASAPEPQPQVALGAATRAR